MELENTLKSLKEGSILVEIFGLGYVGFPLAVRLSNAGLNIIGIDTNKKRIERLDGGNLMDSEVYLKENFTKSRINKRLNFSVSPLKSQKSKIGIICVPTPIPDERKESDVFVKTAVKNFLSTAKKGDVIILESSIEVGVTEKISKIIEENNFKIGENFGLCFCPERIDPANKEWRIENIPRVIYCSDNTTFQIAEQIYERVNGANLIQVSSPRVAEVVKSFENAFRLVNISLVNELAILCDQLEISVHEVIKAAATKPFGFMLHYPGAGAGGHCIPKDPRFLLASAKKFGSNFGTIENALRINTNMPIYVCKSINQLIDKMKLKKSILVWGLSYKANVEDMRDSASFKMIDEFSKRGFKVFGYDPYFKDELIEKYLIENNLKEINFEPCDSLDNDILKKVSCICIVQHHEISNKKIKDIYKKSQVPLIYDCQNKLVRDSDSKTVLSFLGG